LHEVLVNGKLHKIRILEKNGDFFNLEVNGKTVKVKLGNFGHEKGFMLEFNGEILRAEIERKPNNILQVKSAGKTFEVQPQYSFHETPLVKAQPSVMVATKKTPLCMQSEKGIVKAPIAGRIVSLKKRVGEEVKKGECLCILDAMKMENEITAPNSGILKEIRVCEGTLVNRGDVLAFIE